MIGLHLIARIAGRAVAFAAQDIETVVDLGPVTPAPRAAPGVIGIAALRSRVVTVIDPGILVGPGAASGPARRAVVGAVDGHLYAILVEALEDVAEYEPVPVPPGLALAGGWAGIGEAMIDRGGEPVLVLALAALIPEAPGLAA